MTPEKVGVFTAALFAARPLKVLATMLAVGVFVGSLGGPGMLLIKIGLFVYAITVIKTASNPTFARQALEEAEYVRGARKELPSKQGALKGKFLDWKRRANKALEDINAQLDAVTDPFVKDQFSSFRPQLQGMVRRVESICASAQELGSLALDEHALATEIAQLEMKAEESTDETAREHYRTAATEKRKLLEGADWVRKMSARMEAELASLDSALERLRSDVSRVITTSRIGSAGASEARTELSGLSTQVAALEATVDELEKLKAQDSRLAGRSRVS